MSDPEDIPGRRKPSRADPVQPDRPGSGKEVEPDAGGSGADGAGSTSAEQQKKQSDDALQNVRNGYG